VFRIIDEFVLDIEHDVSFANTDFRDNVDQIKNWYKRRHAFLVQYLKENPVTNKYEEYRPEVFDEIPEETPLYLNSLKLYRKQMRFL